jgi:enterochelin esterase family protein
VWIYTPPEYRPEIHRYPVCYFLDGEAYLLSARVPMIIDALIAQQEITAPIAVFIETSSGGAVESAEVEMIARLLIDDVVPWVDAHYATSTDPQDRIIGGAQRNAAVALHTALGAPEIFGGVIAQSPSADLLTTEIARQIGALLTHGIGLPRCYMDVGRYEPVAAQKYAHTLCSALLTGGSVLSYQEFAGDGGFLGWRSTMPDALRVHFGASTISDL